MSGLRGQNPVGILTCSHANLSNTDKEQGMTPLWLRVREFPRRAFGRPGSSHGAGKAGTCPRTPRSRGGELAVRGGASFWEALDWDKFQLSRRTVDECGGHCLQFELLVFDEQSQKWQRHRKHPNPWMKPGPESDHYQLRN